MTEPAPPELEEAIDTALGLQMISIRLPKRLIEDYKLLSEFHGIGYQPLMRDALSTFARDDMRRILSAELVASKRVSDGVDIDRVHWRESA